MSYPRIIDAICSELRNRYATVDEESGSAPAVVVAEIIERQSAMPDYLQFPMRVLTYGFDVIGMFNGGKRFQNMNSDARARQLDAWKHSHFGVCRNFVRFYESLYLLITLQEEDS